LQAEKLELSKLPIPIVVECGKGEKARIVYNEAAQERDKKEQEKKAAKAAKKRESKKSMCPQLLRSVYFGALCARHVGSLRLVAACA
jgi:hypothetical protein